VNLKIHKELPYADEIEYEYRMLCGRGDSRISPYIVPFIGDLNKEVWTTAEPEYASQLIMEACGRNDNELYGMDKHDFIKAAHRGDIQGFRSILPHKDISYGVYLYLNTLHVSHTDFFEDIVNSPIKCVW
jgi:hypothetical protein